MQVFQWLLVLLVGAVCLTAIARRINVPYPSFLALGGVAIALVPGAPQLTLDPALMLALFVAPVLLDAAYDTCEVQAGTRARKHERIVGQDLVAVSMHRPLSDARFSAIARVTRERPTDANRHLHECSRRLMDSDTMQAMNAIHDLPRRHAITVTEYVRMGEAHVFAHDARLELMEGEIVEMAPIGSAHAAVVDMLDTLLREVAPKAIVRVQSPLVLGERSAPQPDVVLLRPRADRYYNSHPTAADALLVVEVADTTLEYDLQVKRSLYARVGVVELWVVDINRRELHVFREPEIDYLNRRVLTARDQTSVAALGDLGFSVSALFPARDGMSI